MNANKSVHQLHINCVKSQVSSVKSSTKLNSCRLFYLCPQLWLYLFATSIFSAALFRFQIRPISPATQQEQAPATVTRGSTTESASEKRVTEDFLGQAKNNKHRASLR